MNKGQLYLIPSPIAEDASPEMTSATVIKVLPDIHFFLVENVRTARRFLSSLKVYESIEALNFQVLDKETKAAVMAELFAPLMEGNHIGIISEAGCPGIADPGSLAVDYAHRNGIKVIPLVGPSSIVLALMASGLNGQRFAFHGYLPIKEEEAVKAIHQLEKASGQQKQTQIFIETPYRNQSVFDKLLKALNAKTKVCVAMDLTGKEEFIQTKSVGEWKKAPLKLEKLPCIFLLEV